MRINDYALAVASKEVLWRKYRANKNGITCSDIIIGAIAGAVGVWAMDTAHNAVAKIAHLLGIAIEQKQPNAVGLGFHYLLGILPGAAYASLWYRYSIVRSGMGIPYGVVLFLLQDEAGAPLLGLSSKPTRYPWQTHARGLVSHVVLGVVTDRIIRSASRTSKRA